MIQPVLRAVQAVSNETIQGVPGLSPSAGVGFAPRPTSVSNCWTMHLSARGAFHSEDPLAWCQRRSRGSSRCLSEADQETQRVSPFVLSNPRLSTQPSRCVGLHRSTIRARPEAIPGLWGGALLLPLRRTHERRSPPSIRAHPGRRKRSGQQPLPYPVFNVHLRRFISEHQSEIGG